MKWPWTKDRSPPSEAARAVAEAIETQPLLPGTVLDVTGISKIMVRSATGHVIVAILFSNKLGNALSNLRIDGVCAFQRTRDTDHIAGAALRRAQMEFEKALQSVLKVRGEEVAVNDQ